jgi:arsenite transporter
LIIKVAWSPLESKGEKVTAAEASIDKESKGLSFFEKYLSVWVALSIVAGIALGKVAPGVAKYLDGLAIYVGDAPVVSIPIAICLFFMMYPIMVKIDFGEVLMAGIRFGQTDGS